jgi:hypothetical protein
VRESAEGRHSPRCCDEMLRRQKKARMRAAENLDSWPWWMLGRLSCRKKQSQHNQTQQRSWMCLTTIAPVEAEGEADAGDAARAAERGC